jgi:O-acetyl-ADP-ribose deacetylase
MIVVLASTIRATDGTSGDKVQPVDKHFSANLSRCAGDSELILSRLLAILSAASGLHGERYPGAFNLISGEVYRPGALVKFSADVIAVDRANMWLEGNAIRLSMCPAELARQYKALYGTPARVHALIDATAERPWQLVANFHLAFPFAPAAQRWYPHSELSGRDYVLQWLDDYAQRRARGCSRAYIEDPAFWQWLLARGYATSDDRASFETWVDMQPVKRQVHIRPSVRVTREWTWTEAAERDAQGTLKTEVRESINSILAALDQPTLGLS